MSGRGKNFIWLLILVVVAAVALSIFMPKGAPQEQPPLSEIVAMAQIGQVKSIEVEGDKLLVTTRGGERLGSYKESGDSMRDILSAAGVAMGGGGVELVVKPAQGGWWSQILLTLIPLMLLGVLFFFIFRGARGAGNQVFNFSRSQARVFTGTRPAVTFGDVAGVEEAKQELEEVVEFLKYPQKFLALGARIPRGVLLVGPPGTGKTLLARAVAGEADVPFFSISGSEFVEMFVGVGASRVRDLFDQAKRSAPSIVFVDEIDAVGRQRGSGLGGSHDEREQTLNQILVEMDGFDSSTNVIVMSATNRPDILDPALLRPGRFDRQVVLDRPDINGRKAILEVHSKGKPLSGSVDLGVVAKETSGFSGADLANLINEAAILAARRDKKEVVMTEIEEAIDRLVAGPERKSRVISQKEKEITAYHEAGHALAARMLPNADPVHKVSIVARGMMGGYTRLLPIEDRHIFTHSQFRDIIAVTLGGYVAEELVFGEVATGSSNDLEHATRMARKMVTEYGMSERLGPRTFGRKEELVFLGREISEQRDYGDKVAEGIDEEVGTIIQNAKNVTRGVLTRERARLTRLAERLISEETLEEEELEKVFTEPLPAPGSEKLSAP